MKSSEFRDLKPADIEREVQARKRELMELRFQSAVGQLASPARVKQLRREVAQLLTVQSGRRNSEAGARPAGK
jgi:large subunit ribosomal protein L29